MVESDDEDGAVALPRAFLLLARDGGAGLTATAGKSTTCGARHASG